MTSSRFDDSPADHPVAPPASHFDPLTRIIFADDFDGGLHGWTALIGNYEKSLDSMLPEWRDLRGPMLSNSTMWDTGSAGSWDGTYAMKLATRPAAGSLAVAVKRVTWRHAGPIQLEARFTFKPEATELELSELNVRYVGIYFDLQDAERRVMPHPRYPGPAYSSTICLKAPHPCAYLLRRVDTASRPFCQVTPSGPWMSTSSPERPSP